MTGGQAINYYIAPGVEYTVSIPNAVNKLVYSRQHFGDNTIPNNLYLYKTTNHQSSKMDFYQTYNSTDSRLKNANAWNLVFQKNTSGKYVAVDRNATDWVYSEVHINDYNMASHPNWMREAVLVHEMLHGYGLRDLGSPYNLANSNTVMFYTSYFWKSNTMSFPNSFNQALNSKY